MTKASFDRRVAAPFLERLVDGDLHFLVEAVSARRRDLDLELYRRQHSKTDSAFIYCGLTKILTVEASSRGTRFLAAESHRELGGFDDAWSEWLTTSDVAAFNDPLLAYINEIAASVHPRWTEHEGRVHQLIASELDGRLKVVSREAVLGFPDRQQRNAALTAACEWLPPSLSAGSATPGGAEADILGVCDGNLWVIEAKPADASAADITDAPAQAFFYSALFAEWVASDPMAYTVLEEMSAQRSAIGLHPKVQEPGHTLSAEFAIIPVAVIGPGALGTAAARRLGTVLAATANEPQHPRCGPIQVWRLDENGVMHPFDAHPVVASGSVSAAANLFEDQARAAAVHWKTTTPSLPDEARDAGPYRGKGRYRFCLPSADTSYNLLPDARENALSRFAAAGIPWHDGVGRFPSPHLLSSQVQCANTLAPHVENPKAIAAIFRNALPIAEVLPFGADTQSRYDATDYLVFEWTGLGNHLQEWTETEPTRGAHSTSTDAAMRYRNPRGQIEIGLIEWKYREYYSSPTLQGGQKQNSTRERRYRHLLENSLGPVRLRGLAFEDFLAEPLYQLMRQQLLAWRIEEARELGAEIVRVCYCAPSANHELWSRLVRPAWEREAALGMSIPPGPLMTLWTRLLRRADRFVYFDTAALLGEEMPTSEEWRIRYGHLANGAQPLPQELDLLQAIDWARIVMRRVSNDGSVLDQLSELILEKPDALPLVTRNALAIRLADLAEQTRQLRADDVFEALYPVDDHGM